MKAAAPRLTSLAALLLTVLSVSPGAAKKPPLSRPDPDSAHIGLKVHVRQGALRLRVAARNVFFVRLEENEDLFSGTEVIPADYSKQGHAYLLNASAGRYAVVACEHAGVPGVRGRWTFYFSQELIRLTEVTVERGDVVFLGRFLLKPGKMKKADPAQSHYLHLIQPIAAVSGSWDLAVANIYLSLAFPHRFENEEAHEVEFWRVARDQHFTHDQAWRDLIDLHLANLGRP